MNRKPLYAAGDIVRVRAWWRGQEVVECEVLDVEAIGPKAPWRQENSYGVRPLLGNPHARSVNESAVVERVGRRGALGMSDAPSKKESNPR